MSARPPVPKLLLLLALSLCAWIEIHAVRSRSDSVVQPPWNAAATQRKPDQVVAYYFHVTARCSTCRMIQAYTEEALASGFGIALANRDLEFRPVNILMRCVSRIIPCRSNCLVPFTIYPADPGRKEERGRPDNQRGSGMLRAAP